MTFVNLILKGVGRETDLYACMRRGPQNVGGATVGGVQ